MELLLQADRLLTVDMVDQADAIFRRVAESDPHDAIAVVGMARCALAREQDHEAYRLAARALTIDPRNDMARRMEARMAEILRHRGEVPGQEPGGTPTPASVPAPAPAPATPVVPPSTPSAPPPTPPSSAPPSTPSAPPAYAERRSFIDRLRGR